MRRASYALTTALLVAGHTSAAEPGAPKPAAAPATPAPAPAGPPAPAPAAPAPTAPAPAPQQPAPAAPQAPSRPGPTPPPEYYVEPGFPAPAPNTAPPPNQNPSGPPGPPGPPPPPPYGMPIYEPPPPGFYPGGPVFEPPPPPEPRHVAPRTALLLGARTGWFIPFGDLWARRTPTGVNGVAWSDYSPSGPMFELNAGARLSRYYSVFALWEHAWLGSGNGDKQSTTLTGQADHGDTDFWGVGVRASTNPDELGFITELAIGYRRARAVFDNGDEMQFTNAPFETRLGLGADYRLNRFVTLSGLATIGFGQFGTIESVSRGEIRDETRYAQADAHAFATFTLGGHFDLFASHD